MTTKHTQGPWIVYDGYIQAKEIEDDPKFSWDTSVDCVCLLPDWGLEYKEEKKANAYLIAAAPDLLEALELFVNNSSVQTSNPAECEIAEKAIAKAKGE